MGMRLSETNAGTPVHIQAYRRGQRVVDIWGKIRKNTQNESQIEIYYYDGINVDLNSSRYEIKATAFFDGKEIELILSNAKIKGFSAGEDNFNENRGAFRIYVSVVIDCEISGQKTTALLIDLSESGFRAAVRGPLYKKNTLISLHIDDEGFDFTLKGKTVWSKALSEEQSVYGCKLAWNTRQRVLLDYIRKKQKVLYDEIQNEIRGI